MSRDAESLRGAPVYCSWSGGKDSALALHEALLDGAEPRLLMTMMTESGRRSRSHGLDRSLLQDQAAALGLPILFGSATWSDYEAAFRAIVEQAVTMGAHTGIFGDIDIDRHRAWVESVCSSVGSTARLPLWQRERSTIMQQLLRDGFQAVVVAIRDGALPKNLLGEPIDLAMLRTFEQAGIDLAGENGEYHTLVIDGPIFQRSLAVRFGDTSLRDGMWFIDARNSVRESNDADGLGERPADGTPPPRWAPRWFGGS